MWGESAGGGQPSQPRPLQVGWAVAVGRRGAASWGCCGLSAPSGFLGGGFFEGSGGSGGEGAAGKRWAPGADRRSAYSSAPPFQNGPLDPLTQDPRPRQNLPPPGAQASRSSADALCSTWPSSRHSAPQPLAAQVAASVGGGSTSSRGPPPALWPSPACSGYLPASCCFPPQIPPVGRVEI